jgi:3-phenylpropionate/trans-cinnamate dioxygenase ferredoxin subunit
MAPAFEDVCADSAVPEGGIIGVRVGGEPVVLARVGGRIYAIGGVCTHAETLLEDGDLEGTTLRCPGHGSGFDIETGEAVHSPAHEPVPAFLVKMEKGRVLVST